MAPPFGSQRPPARDGYLIASWGPTCVATQRAAGRERPLGPDRTSLYRGPTDQGGEGGSSRAFELIARAASPPFPKSWGWRQLRHARGGAAAGGGWSRKRKRRSEREVGPSRSWSLGDGE